MADKVYRVFSPSRDILLTTYTVSREEAEKVAAALNKCYPGEPDWSARAMMMEKES